MKFYSMIIRDANSDGNKYRERAEFVFRRWHDIDSIAEFNLITDELKHTTMKDGRGRILCVAERIGYDRYKRKTLYKIGYDRFDQKRLYIVKRSHGSKLPFTEVNELALNYWFGNKKVGVS